MKPMITEENLPRIRLLRSLDFVKHNSRTLKTKEHANQLAFCRCYQTYYQTEASSSKWLSLQQNEVLGQVRVKYQLATRVNKDQIASAK